MPGTIIAGITTALTTAGIGAETAGILSPILAGAGTGAITSAATGGNILKGALEGGISGGFIGDLGPLVSSTLDIGATAGDALAGAASGAINSGISGTNPLTGAVEGGVGGALLGPGKGGYGGGSSAAPTGGGTSAISTTAPGGLPTGATPDLTTLSAGLNPSAPDFASAGLTGPLPTGTGGATAPISGVSSGGIVGVTPGAPPVPAAATGGVDGILKSLGLGTKDILPTLGLAGAAFKQGPTGAEKALVAEARGLGTQSQALSSYLFNGTLPPGAQAAVDQATRAAQARTKSTFASLGLSGSTAEADALNQITSGAQAQVFQMADQLLAQGVNEAGLSADLYQAILNFQTSQNKELSDAIAGFAAASQGTGVTPKPTGTA